MHPHLAQQQKNEKSYTLDIRKRNAKLANALIWFFQLPETVIK
jgi:hypothetical protein